MVVLIVIVAIIIVTVIIMLAEDSSKETKREKYGDAVGQMAQGTANAIKNIANTLTEPSSKREIRVAKENLARRNTRLFTFDWYDDKDMLQRYLSLDDDIKSSLKILNCPEETWLVLAKEIFYIGVITKEARDKMDYSQRKESFLRQHIITEWGNRDGICKTISGLIKEALAYFDISVDDWIKYGDVVVDMYELGNRPYMKEFGILMPIKSMPNNLHTII